MGWASARTDRKDFVKTLRLSAALGALTLTASTTCAAVIDLSNPLGPSGGYTSEAYYQGMLGGQPMTAAQQAYAGQEDQLRLQGFLSELGGDIALGQIFYHMAYGITPPPPPSALDLASAGSDLSPPSTTPSGPVTGASATAVPEASNWVMMLLGFAGLSYAGYRASRKTAAAA
jgi:hypothetical protein